MFSWIAKGFEDIGKFFESLINGLSDLGKDIGNWFSDLGTDIGNWFDTLWTNLDNGLRTLSDKVNDGIFGVVDHFKEKEKKEETEEEKQENEGTAIINDGVSGVKNKFGFVDNIKTNVNDMVDVITDTTNAPRLTMNIKSKWYSGNITVVDLSWYDQYREYGDSIICMFCYLSFLWNIFVKLPDIIQGAGASSYSREMLDDIRVYKNTGVGRVSNIRRR